MIKIKKMDLDKEYECSPAKVGKKGKRMEYPYDSKINFHSKSITDNLPELKVGDKVILTIEAEVCSTETNVRERDGEKESTKSVGFQMTGLDVKSQTKEKKDPAYNIVGDME